MQYMKLYKVYFKVRGSKTTRGDTMTVPATSSKQARNQGISELKRRGNFTVIKTKLIKTKLIRG